jgi:hypothetical protein
MHIYYVYERNARGKNEMTGITFVTYLDTGRHVWRAFYQDRRLGDFTDRSDAVWDIRKVRGY